MKDEVEIKKSTSGRVRNKEIYCCSRCIAISENAVSFDAEIHRYHDTASCRKANIVVAKNLKVSLSYPFNGEIFVKEEERELINHCIERAKVIFNGEFFW